MSAADLPEGAEIFLDETNWLRKQLDLPPLHRQWPWRSFGGFGSERYTDEYADLLLAGGARLRVGDGEEQP